MRRPSAHEIDLLNQRITGSTSSNVLDYGKLHAAVERPFTDVFGHEPFPGACAKAAVLMHSLVTTHPFLDGNKRTAWIAGWTFLDRNGYRLVATTDDAEATVLAVSVSIFTLDELREWIDERSFPAG